MNKRIFIAAGLSSLLLSSCSAASQSSQPDETTASTTTAASTTEATTIVDVTDAPETAATTVVDVTDAPETAATTVVDVTDAPETAATTAAETDAPQAERTDVQKLLDAALNSTEFPIMMMEGTDRAENLEYLGVDESLVEDYAFSQCGITTSISEVVIIKAKSGSEKEVKEQLQAHKQALIDTYAWYPAQIEEANNTVVGTKDSYVFLVCHTEPDDAVDAIKDEIKKLA